MKEFLVTIPIAGAITIILKAKSEKDALEQAVRRLAEEDKLFKNIEMGGEWELESLETYRALFEGNVSHVSTSEAHAEEY